jgi:hypothetical protein
VRRFAVSIALFLLAGCAGSGMSEVECRSADWRGIGFEDGARGLAPEAIRTHRMACGEHGVAPSLDDYLAGHAEGLERYCQPRNGWLLGESGQYYAGICPEELEDPFLTAYEDAYGLYERRTRVQNVRHRLHQKQSRAQQIERLVVDKTARLVSADLEPAGRAALVVDLKHLAEERVAADAAIQELEHDLADAEDDYDHYRSAVANRAVD